MRVGMLWLDPRDDSDLARRVARAAAYYADKYGRKATLCVVHPETAGEQPPSTVAELTLRVRPDVLRQHFWIGVDEAAA
ncbi:MAG TPA: hypothetical protein VK449_06945 [Anaerolineales bacterium]|nr:hypothetical protein [Anaerolineales bacterium]